MFGNTTIDKHVRPPLKLQNGPSWGSDVWTKNINKHIYSILIYLSRPKTVILEQN